MPGFPLTDPKLFPVPLDETLRVLGDRGHVDHLSLSRTGSGEWQASCRPKGETGYRVSIGPCMITAILKAVAPSYDREWYQLLGDEYRDVFEDVRDDDDELEDVLG